MKNEGLQRQDARYLKTQRSLRAAALLLARSEEISSISVSDLCRAAGVNRATFYRHATTPFEILEAAIVEDLDSLREVFLSGALDATPDFPSLWRQAVLGTVAHVERFSEVYRTGFGVGSYGQLQTLLSRHISTSMLYLLSENPGLLPPHDKSHEEFFIESAASSLGHGLTAVLQVWLRSGDGDVDLYSAAVMHTLPSWMVQSSSGDGLSKVVAIDKKSRANSKKEK